MTTGHEIAMALRAAYLALHRRADAHFASRGVTADQFVLLAALAEGCDAVTQQQLVRRASSDPNTVRAMLLLLEGRGLVARRRHPTDGRARSVTLTAKGRRTFAELSAGSEPLRARLLAALRPDEVVALLGLLGRVAEVMAPPEGGRVRARRRRAAPATNGIRTTGAGGPNPLTACRGSAAGLLGGRVNRSATGDGTGRHGAESTRPSGISPTDFGPSPT
jgi:DNA-binding MarR family transcriptional regulator